MAQLKQNYVEQITYDLRYDPRQKRLSKKAQIKKKLAKFCQKIAYDWQGIEKKAQTKKTPSNLVLLMLDEIKK